MKPLPNGVQAALDEALARTPEERLLLAKATRRVREWVECGPIFVERLMAYHYSRMDGPVEKYSDLELDITEHVR